MSHFRGRGGGGLHGSLIAPSGLPDTSHTLPIQPNKARSLPPDRQFDSIEHGPRARDTVPAPTDHSHASPHFRPENERACTG
eukprot:9491638-Pyramimonas_sp.AAC.1